AKLDFAAVLPGGNVGSRPLDFGRRHLRGDGAAPDQLVEPRLVAVERAGDLFRPARDVGRADRLMRLLRVLRLRVIAARRVRDVAVAVVAADLAADGGDRFRRDVD